MNCPICGTVCDDRDFYCFRCGAGLQPLRQPKKGTHLVPILILLLLTVLGSSASRVILCGIPVGVGVLTYLVCVVLCKAISREDCLLLPKGDKISKILGL